MDTHDFLGRHRGNSQRICLAEVGFVGKGKLAEVIHSADVAQIKVGELLRVESGVLFERGELRSDTSPLLFGHVHVFLFSIAMRASLRIWLTTHLGFLRFPVYREHAIHCTPRMTL